MNLTVPAAAAALETAFLDMLREGPEASGRSSPRRGRSRWPAAPRPCPARSFLVTCGADVPFARRRRRDGAAAQLARVGVRAASPHPRVGAVPATPGEAGAQAREAPCPAGGRARKNRGEGLGVPAHRLPRGLQGRRPLRGGRRPAGVVTNICFMPTSLLHGIDKKRGGVHSKVSLSNPRCKRDSD